MTFHSRKLLLSAALFLGLAATASAEDVKLRYLASQGGLSAHELAAELGYFKGTGITIENVGYAAGGPASLIALASGDVEIGSAATAARSSPSCFCAACASSRQTGKASSRMPEASKASRRMPATSPDARPRR